MRPPSWAMEAQRRATQSKEAAMATLRRCAAESGNPEAQQTLRDIRHGDDAEKIAKRAHWAGSGMVPHFMRGALRTLGNIAVASVILFEIKKYGVCDKPYAYIAKCAGTSSKTVQRTVRILKLLDIDVVRRYDLPSIIKTTCSKIYRWITRNSTSGQTSPNKLIIESHFWRAKIERPKRRLKIASAAVP